MTIRNDAPVAGEVYEGEVKNVKDFGAFVQFGFSNDGMVHISEISHERIGSVSDVVKPGQKVKVRFLGLDPKGRFKLSMKQV